MFQGMARGKVGDVVFYRMDGEQMSRVRNRHPKNPKTIAQLYQRAIMATIVRAYSAGSEIFDHSFQGKQVGMENMRAFLSRNMMVLRNNIKNDVDGAVAIANQKGAVVAPKAVSPVPVIGLIASEGSLTQDLFVYNSYGSDGILQLKTPAVGSDATIKLADWAANHGLRAGDIYTFVAFANNDEKVMYQLAGNTSNYAKQFACAFGWYRLTVKDTVADKTAASATFEDLFDIETDGNVFQGTIATTTLLGQTIVIHDLMQYEPTGATFGVIRSRDDSKMRSTCEMVSISNSEQWGIRTSYLIEVWEKEIDTLGNSTLILEGGDVDGAVNVPSTGGNTGGGAGTPPMGGE